MTETANSPLVTAYELLAAARAELPDPDFVSDEDREIRLRRLGQRIDACLSVTDYMKHRCGDEKAQTSNLVADLRSKLRGHAPILHDGETVKAKCVACGNFNRFWYIVEACNFCQSCVSEALSGDGPSFCSAHQARHPGCPLCYPNLTVPELNAQYAKIIRETPAVETSPLPETLRDPIRLMNIIDAMKVAEAVFEQYKLDQPKWWKRMDGTPILNDITVRMAKAFTPLPVETGEHFMTDEQIKHMVNRFLGWRLPENFSPDDGISFQAEYNVEYNASRGLPPARRQPSGTNLLDAKQAEAMVRYMIEGMPSVVNGKGDGT